MMNNVVLKMQGFSIINEQWKQMVTYKITHTASNIYTKFMPAIQNFTEYLSRSINNILPTREQIHHAATYYLKPIFVLLCIWCLKRCLGVGGTTSTVKMMVAPGMAPLKIARATFEASPKAYFANLRHVSKVVV